MKLKTLLEAKEFNPAKLANAKLKEIGIKGAVVKPNHFDGTNMTTVKTIKLNPSTFGALSPVFKSAEFDIKVGYQAEKEFIKMAIHYSWEHERGSNGYRAEYVYDNGKWDRWS